MMMATDTERLGMIADVIEDGIEHDSVDGEPDFRAAFEIDVGAFSNGHELVVATIQAEGPAESRRDFIDRIYFHHEGLANVPDFELDPALRSLGRPRASGVQFIVARDQELNIRGLHLEQLATINTWDEDFYVYLLDAEREGMGPGISGSGEPPKAVAWEIEKSASTSEPVPVN
jgi:hypothetical protein